MDSTILLLFAAFFCAGLRWRNRRADYHKRLMLLASLSLMVPAISRMPLPWIQNDDTGYVTFALMDLCVLALVGWDALRLRRLHPAFAVGAPLLIGSLHVAYEVFQQPAWSHFATRMLS